MGRPSAPFDLTLSDKATERILKPYISYRRLVITMLPLNFNRKPAMGSPMEPSHLTLSDIERSNTRPFIFRSLISRKGAQLGPI